MSLKAERSILVKLASNSYLKEEIVCSEIVAPGNIVIPDGTGGVKLNDVADVDCGLMIALEDPLTQGRTIDDAYVSGDLVQIGNMPKGAWFQVKAPTGTYTDGQKLTCNGAGAVKAIVGTEVPIVRVRETKTLAAAGFITVQAL